MKGQVLDFTVDENSGVISGTDGVRYSFKKEDWKDDREPARGMAVDFEADGETAKSIYVGLGSKTAGAKDKTVAGLLAILLGGLGIHKFYLGFTGPALVFLLVNTVGLAVTWLLLFIPNYVLGVIALVEGIIYLTKSDEEFEQTYVVEKKKWF